MHAVVVVPSPSQDAWKLVLSRYSLNPAWCRAGWMKSPLFWIGFLTQGCNLILGSPAAPQAEIEQKALGMPWTGDRGICESTGQLMAREDRLAAVTHEKVFRPRLRARQSPLSDPDSAPPARGFPNRPLAGNPSPPGSPISPDSQTVGLSFTAATLADTSGFPPDSMGAAGPTQFLVVINGRVRTFNKSTGSADGVLNTTTDNFFSSVMTPPVSNNFTSDPRVRYDRLSGRWFVSIIDVPGLAGSLPNRVLLALSDSGTITAGTLWTYFYFQQDLVSPAGDTGKFADYPTLGIDANALYIGVNIFGRRGNPSAFSNTSVFVVRKNSVLSGGPIVVTAFRSLIKKVQGLNTGPYTPQGVDNYDPDAAEGYVIGVDITSLARLQLRRISDPGGTPSMSGNSSVAITATAAPIKVPHLGNTGGSSGNLDGLDNRLLAAHVRNGRLWTTHNIGVNNTGSSSGTITRNAVRWYELQGIASGQSPSVFQSGTFFQPSSVNSTDQRHYWTGTIMVSGQGHAAMGFSVAGANEYANAGTAGRLNGRAPGWRSIGNNGPADSLHIQPYCLQPSGRSWRHRRPSLGRFLLHQSRSERRHDHVDHPGVLRFGGFLRREGCPAACSTAGNSVRLQSVLRHDRSGQRRCDGVGVLRQRFRLF